MKSNTKKSFQMIHETKYYYFVLKKMEEFEE